MGASQTPLSNFDGVEEEEESGDEEEGDRANQSLDDLFGKVIADMEKDLSDLPDMFSDEDINKQAQIVVRESKKSAEQDSMFISSMSQPLAAARRKSRETPPSKYSKKKKLEKVEEG